eukprot:s4570_g4.t1
MDNPWPMADRPRPTGHRPTSFPWRLGAEELVSRVFPAIQRRPPVTRDAPDHPADTKRMALTSRQACRAGCAQRKAVEFQERPGRGDTLDAGVGVATAQASLSDEARSKLLQTSDEISRRMEELLSRRGKPLKALLDPVS